MFLMGSPFSALPPQRVQPQPGQSVFSVPGFFAQARSGIEGRQPLADGELGELRDTLDF